MAFVAEVKARLGLDTTDFQRALTKTQADLGKLGGDTNKKLARSFGGDDAIKGLLQGAGIGSLEAIVEKLTSGFREAAESAKSIMETSAKTLGIYESIFSGRRTDEQNLEVNLRKQVGLQKEMAETAAQFETRKIYGPTGRVDTVQQVTREADPKRASEIALSLAELSKEELALREKIGKTNDDNAAKQVTRQAAEIASMLKLQEMERANADQTRTDEENIAKLLEDRAGIMSLASETDYERKQDAAKIDGKILELEKRITQEKIRQAKEQKDIADKLRDAEKSLAKAQSDEDDGFADRSGLSLGEAANAKAGSVRVQARRVQFLEDRAKRRRGSGFEAEAFEDTSRALKIRKSMGALSQSERDPMRSTAESIRKSEEHLAEIRASLKPEKVK